MFIFVSNRSIVSIYILVSAKCLIGWWIWLLFSLHEMHTNENIFFRPQYPFRTYLQTLNIPNNGKPLWLFAVYSPKIFSMKNFDNDYYYHPMEFACLWAYEMRMNNKLVGSWLMISISIEICDSVLKLLRNVIPFSIYCCHIEYIVKTPPENAINSVYLYEFRTRKYFQHILFWTLKELSKTFLFLYEKCLLLVL